MDDQTIVRLIEILETDPDFFVPVKKLWLMLRGEGLALDIELERFHHMLLEDDRFEFTSGVNHREGFENDPEFADEIEQEMETLGFFSGPRVKLVAREITPEDIIAGLSQSLTRMNEALQNAWEARPKNDQETEDQLLEILAAGQRLDREVQELMNKQLSDVKDNSA
jgi:hypothetical protein